MVAHGVKTLIYSSTCATYGEPDKMPITEDTPQVEILTSVSLLSLLFQVGALLTAFSFHISSCI